MQIKQKNSAATTSVVAAGAAAALNKVKGVKLFEHSSKTQIYNTALARIHLAIIYISPFSKDRLLCVRLVVKYYSVCVI